MSNTPDKLTLMLTSIGAIVLIPIIFFGVIILGTLGGCLIGWFVGLFFGDTILGIINQLGIHNVAMWQVGAFLGFIGPFFRTISTKKG